MWIEFLYNTHIFSPWYIGRTAAVPGGNGLQTSFADDKSFFGDLYLIISLLPENANPIRKGIRSERVTG